MPVDMSIPNSIMGAYFQGVRLREMREKEQQDQINKEKGFIEQKRQFDEAQKRAGEQFKLTHQLHENQFKQGQLRNQLAFQAGMTRGEIQPGSTMEDPQFSTPEQYGQAQYERVKPQLDAQNKALIDRYIAEQAAMAQRMKVVEDEKSASALKLQEQKDKEAMARVKEQNLGRKETAAMKAAAKKAGDTSPLDPAGMEFLFDAVESGKRTQEDVLKEFSTKEKYKVFADMRKRGIVAPTRKQIQNIENLNSLRSVYKTYARLNDIIAKEGQLARQNNEYAALVEQAVATLGTISKNLGDEKGALSKADIDRARGFLPTLSEDAWSKVRRGKSSNLVKMDNFLRLMTERQNTALAPYSDRQKMRLVETFNLLPIAKAKGEREIP